MPSLITNSRDKDIKRAAEFVSEKVYFPFHNGQIFTNVSLRDIDIFDC